MSTDHFVSVLPRLPRAKNKIEHICIHGGILIGGYSGKAVGIVVSLLWAPLLFLWRMTRALARFIFVFIVKPSVFLMLCSVVLFIIWAVVCFIGLVHGVFHWQ
eukprot:gnl/MRDRNA2_/MRDRNA2_112320_c0_seq1.p1 gnl/MRDRNA2_/MRDRNA2_112320_c0~~gnl/MRDRNA2_/MRDRNA2_112320_c0_seq1.p1  ORF type:complete len:103 (+),score=1.71 gnl/MRDRNA2_/MRDRNA2_112320_c0_seq1:119-427(+)